MKIVWIHSGPSSFCSGWDKLQRRNAPFLRNSLLFCSVLAFPLKLLYTKAETWGTLSFFYWMSLCKLCFINVSNNWKLDFARKSLENNEISLMYSIKSRSRMKRCSPHLHVTKWVKVKRVRNRQKPLRESMAHCFSQNANRENFKL